MLSSCIRRNIAQFSMLRCQATKLSSMLYNVPCCDSCLVPNTGGNLHWCSAKLQSSKANRCWFNENSFSGKALFPEVFHLLSPSLSIKVGTVTLLLFILIFT
ncbi:hypothetical protein ATANTOWER_029329 [Ataeniobius toweri]|uniref:Uncharacterized protein n=1 Tax=Ataeniobius toweri TaxID=208326 RepID=A0ABU7AIJ7_9TELE|nr:hypothetical protein [Ataeniobius toweri]